MKMLSLLEETPGLWADMFQRHLWKGLKSAFGMWIAVDVLFNSRFDNAGDGGREIQDIYDFIVGKKNNDL